MNVEFIGPVVTNPSSITYVSEIRFAVVSSISGDVYGYFSGLWYAECFAQECYRRYCEKGINMKKPVIMEITKEDDVITGKIVETKW